MKRVSEEAPVRRILEQADTMVKSDNIAPGFSAVVVEIVHEDLTPEVPPCFEGTVLYFPGVAAKELLGILLVND